MAKRYIFNITFRGKIIDKIDVVGNDVDTAIDEVNAIALDKFQVELIETLEEE